jgi:glutathione-regulated potassium-efflux system protein KefB
MDPAQGAHYLFDAVVMLGAALVCVLLFRRLGLGATLGYLVAGATIGPYGLGLVGGAEGKMGIAEIGIVLLLFIVGLELSPGRIWRLRREIFGFGIAQVVLCGLALALAICAFGFSGGAALALGLPLALSSTAQVLPMLRSAGRLSTPFGERAFSILLMQDLAIVPLITIIAALSRAPAAPDAPPGWLLAVYTVAAVAGLVVAGRLILSPLFRLIGGLGEREMFVAAGLFTVLASAAIMASLHLSTALGAFVAGVMLADSPYRHELEVDVEPFRTILLGLFFVTVGMLLDLPAVVARPVFVVGLAVTVILIKAVVIYVLGRIARMENRQALSLGLLLSQGGEFGFVLFAQASSARLIDPAAASLLGAVVTLSMATTPFLMAFTRRFTAVAPVRDDLDGPERASASHAIIVGYGRFGQTVAQMLMARGASITLIDSNPRQIDRSGDFGMKVYYGDGLRVDVLRQAGAEEARILVFCLDDRKLDPGRLSLIADAFPKARLLIRVFDRQHHMAFEGIELFATVRELFESAVLLGRDALRALGVEDREVERIEREYRRRDARRLELQSRSGDIRIARELMFKPDQPLEEGEESA